MHDITRTVLDTAPTVSLSSQPLHWYHTHLICGVNFVIHWNETAMGLHVFPIPIPSPTSLSTRYPYVFPVHHVWVRVSCIQPGLVICFTLDTIHASMLFSWNIPASPSPTEAKRLFYKSVSFFFFFSAYRVIINIFLNSIYMCYYIVMVFIFLA